MPTTATLVAPGCQTKPKTSLIFAVAGRFLEMLLEGES